MRDWTLGLIALVMVLGTLAFPKEANQTPYFASVVKLTTATARCSGFVLGKDLVITAGHCVGGDKTRIIFDDGMSVEATTAFVGSHRGADFAILIAATGERKPLKPATYIRPMGEATMIGYPWVADRQVIEAGQVIYGDDRFIRIASYAFPGSSGSPVFDEDFNVIGICTTTEYPAPVFTGTSIKLVVMKLKELGLRK